jgi:hypothetical protein
VFAWLKESSSTGFIRFGENPNIRQQDGLKVPFLCGACEGRFNRWETPFATQFFRPLHEGTSISFDYESWMAKCCTSVAWRTLTYLKETGALQDWPRDLMLLADDALETWRIFLLDRRSDVAQFEQHLILMDSIAESAESQLPRKINRYLLRAVDMDVLASSSSAFVYVKMGRVVLVGFVLEPRSSDWRGTRINVARGRLAPSSLQVPGWLWAHMKHRAEVIAEVDESISTRQKTKIWRSRQVDRSRVLQSETLRASMEDLRLAEPWRGETGHEGKAVPDKDDTSAVGPS